MAASTLGAVVYRGPSQIDGSPIVGIVTWHSRNDKTGNMAQLWILPATVSPGVAIGAGEDRGVCGECPLRMFTAGGERQIRACYVNIMGPQSVWRTWRDGKYQPLSPRAASRRLRGRMVRLGAYGDPAALPLQTLRELVREARGHTGYTHQWGTCDPRYAELIMASVEGAAPVPAGWRGFIVSRDPRPDAVICPASEEAGKRTTCEQCGLCNGTLGNSGKSITIQPHGSGARGVQ